MSDIYLNLLMSAPQSAKKAGSKDQFEYAEDQLLEDFTDASLSDEDPSKDQLTPHAIKKAKRKEELKAVSHSLTKKDLQLEKAFETLAKETDLEEDKYQEMMGQLFQIPVYLEQIDFSKPLTEKLTTLLADIGGSNKLPNDDGVQVVVRKLDKGTIIIGSDGFGDNMEAKSQGVSPRETFLHLQKACGNDPAKLEEFHRKFGNAEDYSTSLNWPNEKKRRCIA